MNLLYAGACPGGEGWRGVATTNYVSRLSLYEKQIRLRDTALFPALIKEAAAMKYELVELRVKDGFVTEYLREIFSITKKQIAGRSVPVSDFTAEQLERIKKGELVWPPCEGSE